MLPWQSLSNPRKWGSKVVAMVMYYNYSTGHISKVVLDALSLRYSMKNKLKVHEYV